MQENIHALIIDDNLTDQKILAQLLTLEGARITQIVDPSELVACISQFEGVDIVFVDLEMPHLNGYEVFNLLKEYFGDTVPLVACTVHTSEVNNARDLGFDSFLGKPVNVAQFPKHFRRILARESIWEFK
jgi:CheY-like chemotaxis protein